MADQHEVALDLDSLEEDGEPLSDGGDTIPVTMVELQRHPALALLAVVVLIPVAGMMLPARRRRRAAGVSQGTQRGEAAAQRTEHGSRAA